MKKILAVAFLALMMLAASSSLVLADEEEDDEENEGGQEETGEQENQVPGFEAAFAFACSLVAAKLLTKRS
jgi:Ca2+/Na+ antiporter